MYMHASDDTLKQVTPVKEQIIQQAPNGDKAGECTEFGCSCANGYVTDDNGTCITQPSTNCFSNQNICSTDASCVTFFTGDSKCVCNDGFIGDGILCTDINECRFDICEDNAICSNTVGSFTCECEDGFEMIGAGFCIDINECTQADICGDNQICENNGGGYSCNCLDGYEQHYKGPEMSCTGDFTHLCVVFNKDF